MRKNKAVIGFRTRKRGDKRQVYPLTARKRKILLGAGIGAATAGAAAYLLGRQALASPLAAGAGTGEPTGAATTGAQQQTGGVRVTSITGRPIPPGWTEYEYLHRSAYLRPGGYYELPGGRRFDKHFRPITKTCPRPAEMDKLPAWWNEVEDLTNQILRGMTPEGGGYSRWSGSVVSARAEAMRQLYPKWKNDPTFVHEYRDTVNAKWMYDAGQARLRGQKFTKTPRDYWQEYGLGLAA